METTEQPAETPADQPPQREARPRRAVKWVIGVLAAVLALLVLFVAAAVYTDRSAFCGTCHEMRPHMAAWASGPHKDVACIDCHVGRNYRDRVAHKFVALGEVVAHFSGDTKFPRPVAASVPDSNCKSCHAQVKPKKAASGFDHDLHQSKAACQVCHADTGHLVPQSALTDAGIFNPSVRRVEATGAAAIVGQGSANVPGHASITCTRCHDLEKTGCAACHKYSAQHFRSVSATLPACPVCHPTAANWAFSHPSQTDCQACHTLPPKHFKPPSGTLPPCAQCHKQAGKSWAFQHPSASADCTLCHAVPTEHFTPTSGQLKPCTQCHPQVGVTWRFKHPSSKSDCRGCHTAPANHSAGQCSVCHHNTGVSFKFVHPSSGAPHGIGGIACNRCHPNGFTTSSCTCH